MPSEHTAEITPTIEPLAIKKIRSRWKQIDSMAGVGLDPDPDKIPPEIWQEVSGRDNVKEGIFAFNRQIIDATAPYAVDYKANLGFYLSSPGMAALQMTFDYLKQEHSQVLRVCDGKFADIGNTAEKIAEFVFGRLDADAVLLNPYLGSDAVRPFTQWRDKAVILCINTSNPSADRVQNLTMAAGEPLWRHILQTSLDEWDENKNIFPVLSATDPKKLIGIRSIIENRPILLAGVGTQDGNLQESIPPCLDEQDYGLLISSSRAILYPQRQPDENFVSASKRAIIELKNTINDIKNASRK